MLTAHRDYKLGGDRSAAFTPLPCPQVLAVWILKRRERRAPITQLAERRQVTGLRRAGAASSAQAGDTWRELIVVRIEFGQ